MIPDSYYTPPHNIGSDVLRIEGDEAHHLSRVMRMERGETLRVVDGMGTAYSVTISDIRHETVICAINARHPRQNEPLVDVTLAVAVLKNGSRFDVMVEKATELGISAIVPLVTARSIPQRARPERWQRIARAAMKQCGRCVLPRVADPLPLIRLLQQDHSGVDRLILHEAATEPLRAAAEVSPASKILVAVGPEGGFSEEEILQAVHAGFRAASLGPRRLRTETAAMTAAAILLTA
jgi:16S rRNA (uracil1498-N3)-methyltransferase